MIGVLDLFSIGIGPSSSHTVGPMRAARSFADALDGGVDRVEVILFGSLGATGRGHATDVAVVAGLAGERPETATPAAMDVARERLAEGRGVLTRGQAVTIELGFRADRLLARHPNALTLTAFGADGQARASQTFYSVGGGAVVEEGVDESVGNDEVRPPFPFSTAAELLAHCEQSGLSISEITFANEAARHTPATVRERLAAVATAMHECVEAGLRTDGILPGGLHVPRRAAALHRRLAADAPLTDRLSVFAMAVNEENAAGGRVVTAPTNGAAGIVPAVLEYVRGHVQIPCIERNGMAAVKAVHAARMALLGDGSHIVSFDAVIRTMRETGRDMSDRYKETSRGGLAVNVVEC